MPEFFDMADVPTNPRLWFIVETDKSPTGGVIVRNVTASDGIGQRHHKVFRDRANDVYFARDCTGWRPLEDEDVKARKSVRGYQYNQAKARSA